MLARKLIIFWWHSPILSPSAVKSTVSCLAYFPALGFGCLLFASVLIGPLACLPLLSKNVTHFSTYLKLNQSSLSCAYFPVQDFGPAAGYLFQASSDSFIGLFASVLIGFGFYRTQLKILRRKV